MSAMLVWSNYEDKTDTEQAVKNHLNVLYWPLLKQNSRPDAVMLRENNYFCSLWHQCGDINVRIRSGAGEITNDIQSHSGFMIND